MINHVKPKSKHKPFDALKWPVCDFEKQGSHLIITIKTGLFVEFVKNVYIVVRRILKFMLRILLPDIIDSNSTSGFTKSSGNLEILTSIY